MTRLITLFGKPINELSFNDLKRERRCHSFLLTRMRYMLNDAYKDAEAHDTEIQNDKVAFFEMYVSALEAMIAECDYYLDRRIEPESNAYHRRPLSLIRGQNAKRRSNLVAESRAKGYANQMAMRDGWGVSWDRDKFFLIAADRGFQTEEMVTSELGKALNLDRTRAKILLDSGRFTWGQVMVTGAFLQMTPKEFCDTFLAGYFTEEFGEYRANEDNINKTELLRRAVRPGKEADPLEGIEQEVVEVGADGRPIDEEEWFD